MSEPVTIIYHADCPDGFGAAYAAWKRFGPQTRCLPLHHGEAWEDIDLSGQDVYILDFSFRREILEKMAVSATSITQIDHHASARGPWAEQLSRTADGAEVFKHPALPITVIFDLDKSGTRLAWEHFFPATELPLLLAHIEDSDLWRFKLPGTRAFGRALRLKPFDFALWDDLIAETASVESPVYQRMLTEGGAIETFFQGEIRRLSKSRLIMPATLRGEAIDPLQAVRHNQSFITSGEQAWRAVTGLAINADSLLASELGHCLAEQSGTFGLIWQLAPGGEVKASLRAAGKVNVAEIALSYGGGGHPNAAGFRLPVLEFMRDILGLVPGTSAE